MLFLYQAKIYLKADNAFCSFVADQKRGLIGMVIVPPNDARSVTVPIFPKIVGEVDIEVSSVFELNLGDSYLSVGADSVRKRLLVEVSVEYFQSLAALFMD